MTITHKIPKLGAAVLLTLLSTTVLAANITDLATTAITEMGALAKLLSVASYVAGVGFAMAGILQFKAHKEAPTQTPLSKPIVMIIVAACLLFLPTVLGIAGASLFGTSATSAAAGGGGTALSGAS